MKRLLTIALILGALATLLALGTWQLQRLEWKQGLIAQAQERPTLPPVPLGELLEEAELQMISSTYGEAQDEAIEGLSYRRTSLEGRFVTEPVRVFTTLSDAEGPYEGPGYWWLQGFETASSIVFVNRGFVPFELAPGLGVRRAPAGVVQLEGLIRPNDVAGRFTPEADYEDGLIYRRDVSQLMQASGVSVALPITIDLAAGVGGELPQAGETKFTFTNRHLEYALTWYGLALCLVGVVGVAWWRRRPVDPADADG
ncbi:MAG: SURF1 family protein [Devosiaceae bacterium]|nr:SURF1 family protein [Devosiaceae bacterium MH13]